MLAKYKLSVKFTQSKKEHKQGEKALYSLSVEVHTVFMKQLWSDYISYLKDNPEGYWFKRKLYGWGWTPAKPAGWITLGLYLLFVFGVVSFAEWTGCAEEESVKLLSLIIGATIIIIVIAWRTGEPPKWQWGMKSHNEK